MNHATVFGRKPGYLIEKIDREILLYHPDETRAVYLNETGALIWDLIDGKRSVGEIVELIERSFPEAPGLAADIHKAFESLEENGALVQAPAAATSAPEAGTMGRRDLFQALAAGGATVSAAILPRLWIAPVVGTVVAPLHAQTSGPTTTTPRPTEP